MVVLNVTSFGLAMDLRCLRNLRFDSWWFCSTVTSKLMVYVLKIHLVSEHVWCEDYLVRNFFLKNLETNQTRTITQFHFLTWPENGVPQNIKSILDFRRWVIFFCLNTFWFWKIWIVFFVGDFIMDAWTVLNSFCDFVI